MADCELERAVAAHLPALRAYARALSESPADADDAVAETLARAWKYSDSFLGHGSFEGWLLRICRNCIIDTRTRHARHRELCHADCIPASLPGPAAAVELTDAIARLPIAQREVIVLIGILGYSYDETAALLRTPVGTIRSRLNRARAALAIGLAPKSAADVAGQVSA